MKGARPKIAAIASIACAMAFLGCRSNGDFGSLDESGIKALKLKLSRDSILFEDFDSAEVDARLHGVDPGSIAGSGLLVRRDGQHLSFADPAGFTRVIVCYKLTSQTGHLFLHANLPEGDFALFDDAKGPWAWKGKGGARFDRADFGQPSASAVGRWVLHEIRIEKGALRYFADQQLFGEVPLTVSTSLKRFEISSNVGGRGIVDFLIVAGASSAARGAWSVEVVVPPNPTRSAPFDTAVLPDGTVLMEGAGSSLVSVSDDGSVKATDYPGGMNFECDGAGVMWYYNFPEGRVYRWGPGLRESGDAARIPPAYSDGSIAVAPDGRTAYIAWWLMDKPESVLYRCTDRGGLEKVLQIPKASYLRAVEVAANGEVFVGCSDGIYRLRRGDTLEPYYLFKQGGLEIAADGLTSDESGNLYFSARGDRRGVYRLSSKGELARIAQFSDPLDLPFGLSWHRDRQVILGVRKEKGEIVSIDLRGAVRVLNRPSGLTTPIAIDQGPRGSILVNGDEIGLLEVDAQHQVHLYCRGMCSYSPPPADFTFDRDGLIYYTCAAPGFVSEIVTIDQKKTIRTLTRAVGSPAGIDTGPGNTIYYADFLRGTVNLLSPSGRSSVVIADLFYPLGLVVDDSGTIWVGMADRRTDVKPGILGERYSTLIARYDGKGTLQETIDFAKWEGAGITFFDVDRSGNLYVPIGRAVLRRDARGAIEVMGDGFANVRGAKVCSDGYLYVTDYSNPALYRIRIP